MKPLYTTSFDELRSYLDGVRAHPRSSADLRVGVNPFITISRETGAGGHHLAVAALEAMSHEADGKFFGDWLIVNEELCKKVLADPALHSLANSFLGEDAEARIEADLSRSLTGRVGNEQWRVFALMRAFAVLGKVILVDEAGALLARDLAYGLHLRLVAPMQCRIRNMRESFRLQEYDAIKRIVEEDEARRLGVLTHFNENVDNPLFYHATWNTGLARLHDLAAECVYWIRMKQEEKTAAAGILSV